MLGEFVEDFDYDKWQTMIAAGQLNPTTVATVELNTDENIKEKEED